MARRSASSFVGWGTVRRAAGAAIAVSTVAACGLSVDDLFTAGSGSGGSGGAATSTSTQTSAQTSASSSSTSAVSSSSSSTSSSTSASSSGGLVCGDGVCSPGESAVFCPQDCAGTSSNSSSSGAGGGMPSCDHPACDQGGPIDGACDPCAAMVCATDPFCCMSMWDGQCVSEANTTCGACCGDGTCNTGEDCNGCPADCGTCPTTTMCAHTVCATGAALDTTKCSDPCVDAVCAQTPTCCGNASWDMGCETLAGQLCGADPCVTAVCAAMPACCTSGWTQACVNAAKTTCATPCTCAHDVCAMGDMLATDCNPCAKALCKADAYCCSTSWDGICVGEVASVCGIACP